MLEKQEETKWKKKKAAGGKKFESLSDGKLIFFFPKPSEEFQIWQKSKFWGS